MRTELAGQINLFGEETAQDAEYSAFVDKFTPKKTTDDCYTPENIYEAVAEWGGGGIWDRPLQLCAAILAGWRL